MPNSVAHCPKCSQPLPEGSSGLCANCAAALVNQLFLVPADRDPARGGLLQAGVMVGKYLLEWEIGRGGMGTVWRAWDEEVGRAVALKVLNALFLPGEKVRQRFLEEVRSAGKLDHPNIVAVLDAGEHQGLAWFAMPLLEGGSLAKVESPRAAAVLVARLARGLAHSHERGILHRDIKPGNILLDTAGEPKLADFGLARDLSAVDRLTLSGEVMGTPAYMAPEQAAGSKDVTISVCQRQRSCSKGRRNGKRRLFLGNTRKSSSSEPLRRCGRLRVKFGAWHGARMAPPCWRVEMVLSLNGRQITGSS